MSFIILSLVVFSMASCGKSGDASGVADVSNSIPANATGVLLINTGQLVAKADMASLKQTEFFKEWLKEIEKEAPEMLPFAKDPEAAGINLAGNMALYFAVPDDYNKTKTAEMAFLMPIGDKVKLEAMIKAALKNEPEAKAVAKDGYSITKIEEAFMIQGEKLFIITNFDDDAKIKNLIKPTGENIKSNASFAKHLKEGKDVMFWMGADPIAKAVLSDPFMGMMLKGGLATAQIPEEGLTGNFMSFYYDFKNGEIDGGMAFDFSEPLKQELGQMFPNKLSVDYSKYIPAENLAMAASLGVNSPGVLNFLAKRGYDKYADQYLALAGLNLGQIKDGITGDLAMAVYAPATDADAPAIVAAIGLKNKAFAEGLIAKFGPMAGVTKQGDKYVFSGGTPMDPETKPMQFFGSIQGDVLLVATSSALLDKAIAGGKNATIAELQEGWMGFYLDYALLEKHHDKITAMLPADEDQISSSKMLLGYNDFSSTKLLMKGDHIDGKMMLKTTNINSLKRLIQIADMMFKDREKIKAEMDKHKTDDGLDDDFFSEGDDKNT